MMHDVLGHAKPIVLPARVKAWAHMIPQGYLNAPVLKDVDDPEKGEGQVGGELLAYGSG